MTTLSDASQTSSSTHPSAPLSVGAGESPLQDPTWHVDGANPPPAVDVRELWAYRELLFFLTARDLKLRYKQTLLGASWAVAQPLVQMGVMTIVLGYIAGLRHKTEVPYAVLTFTGLVPWQLFASALGNASNSLVGNERLVTKVYFPRLIIPTAAVLARLVDFMVCLAVLALMMSIYLYDGRLAMPGAPLLLLPLYTAWTLVLALGAGLFFSAMNVKWRDVGHLVPFILQILMWFSGVYMSSSIVPDRFRDLYHLNPVANIIDGFRGCLLSQPFPNLWPTAVSAAATLLLLALALRYFRRAEETFADVI